MGARRWAILLILATLLACTSKPKAPERPPHATLGASQASERRFRPLMRRWVLGDLAERDRLDGHLQNFVKRHPGDPLVILADVLRAMHKIDRDKVADARRLARPGLSAPHGTTRDLAVLATGAADRRGGLFERALGLLQPLLHKMVDSFATDMLNRELVYAAIGAKKYNAAIQYMAIWEREADAGRRTEVHQAIAKLLVLTPQQDLLAALRGQAQKGVIAWSVEMAQSIAQQLALVAVEAHDSALARELVRDFGALLGRYGESVARLAVDSGRARVRANTVGALLALNQGALRRRSVDLAAGMAFGLGLPGSTSRLVTRDVGSKPDEIVAALHALAAEGAAVIVAGVDEAHIPVAVKFAEQESVAVILLSGRGDNDGPFVFRAGVSTAETVGVLARELTKEGAHNITALGAPIGDLPGAVGLRAACWPKLDAAALRSAGTDALVILDGADCLQPMANADLPGWPIGVGLGATYTKPGRSARTVLTLASGIFGADETDTRLRVWRKSRRPDPSWWVALGHDAARLARAAVEGLPQMSIDPQAVKATRADAAASLAQGRAELWTTDAKGFNAKRRLARTITLERGRAKP